MEFEILNSHWKMVEVKKGYLIDRYNAEHETKAYMVFGLTEYSSHTIYVNKEMCLEQKKKTFAHELMHAYLWEIGVCDNDTFNEEDICNFSASAREIINNIIDNVVFQSDSGL